MGMIRKTSVVFWKFCEGSTLPGISATLPNSSSRFQAAPQRWLARKALKFKKREARFRVRFCRKNIIGRVAYSKLYHACMRRASWLELACPKILGSTFPVALAISALVKFSAVHGSPTPIHSENAEPVARAQIATKFLVLDQDAVSSLVPEGDTTFIIFVARSSALDRFTFIKENKPARGELRIAVANEKLSADSDKWTPVDGAVSFKRKRLFNVSMLGVEAKYVRLVFHIEHEENIGQVNPSEAFVLN